MVPNNAPNNRKYHYPNSAEQSENEADSANNWLNNAPEQSNKP